MESSFSLRRALPIANCISPDRTLRNKSQSDYLGSMFNEDGCNRPSLGRCEEPKHVICGPGRRPEGRSNNKRGQLGLHPSPLLHNDRPYPN